MKKILIGACLVSLIAVPAMAADTYTGGMVESLNQKINKVASPVVNKEKEIKQKDMALKQKQKEAQEIQQKQIEARQKAQQELVTKKKQQVQAQKDLFKKEKEEIKSIFTIK